MLREFALSTKEGLALMVLAEALLRVPDARTADRFIEDKLGQGDFVASRDQIQRVPGQCLGLGARHVGARDPAGRNAARAPSARLAKRLGAPAVRAATRQAMRLMGSHFVLGETIEAALARARPQAPAPRYSFDMLGEGARTAADAERYFNAYAGAIEAIGAQRRHASAARPARHLGQALGAASALRGVEPRGGCWPSWCRG